MFHRFHDLKTGQDPDMNGGGSRSSTPAEPPGSRVMFPPMLRQDLTHHQVTPQHPNTSSPGPGGFVGQGASLMALGHNVMFPGSKLMAGSAHEAHRYMTEAYRLATGEAEAHRMPYPVGDASSSLLGAETHRNTPSTNSSAGAERSHTASQRHSDRVHYSNSESLPPHVNLDTARMDGHSARLLSALERQPHNANKPTVLKNESEPPPYHKPTSNSVDNSHLSSHGHAFKSKSGSGSTVAGSHHMFPLPFPPSFHQYSEEGNFKRQYFDEAFTPRRESVVDASSTDSHPQVNRGKLDVPNSGGGAELNRFGGGCHNQEIFSHNEPARGGNRTDISGDINLMAQAASSSHTDLLGRPKIPKGGRQLKAYKCQVCDMEFKNGTQLKNHFWRHTGEKPYACPTCQATFTQQSNLKTHMRIHTGERPYGCEECSATFTQISNLRTHQKIHTGEKPYECDVCFTRFSQQSNLKSHKLIHSGERPFACDECGAAFVQSTHLRNHKRIHTNERPYACEQCGAKFRQLSNLKTHEKIHTGERPHVCEECGSAFAQKSNLKSHMMKLHSQEGTPSRRGRKKKLEAIKPYTCDQCGAKFTMMSNLKIHMRLHTGEKPYHCAVCDASFAQKSNLKTHEQTHSDERPFKCNECPAAFRQKTNLKTHKMKKHPVKSLKIKILQDSQYIMQDISQVIDGEDGEGGSSHLIEEPIVQIREGKDDPVHAMGGVGDTGMVKLEGDPYGTPEGMIPQHQTVPLIPQTCPPSANPYDSPNF